MIYNRLDELGNALFIQNWNYVTEKKYRYLKFESLHKGRTINPWVLAISRNELDISMQ